MSSELTPEKIAWLKQCLSSRLHHNHIAHQMLEAAPSLIKAAEEADRLRFGIFWAYQFAGAYGASAEALDNLSALSQREIPPHEWPVSRPEALLAAEEAQLLQDRIRFLENELNLTRQTRDEFEQQLMDAREALGRADMDCAKLRLADREMGEADRERLDSATEFDMGEVGRAMNGGTFRMRVAIRKCEGHRLPQTIMWKVCETSGGAILSKDGEWEYEPQPSSRDDEFYSRCRFDTFDAARAALDGI